LFRLIMTCLYASVVDGVYLTLTELSIALNEKKDFERDCPVNLNGVCWFALDGIVQSFVVGLSSRIHG